MNLYSSSVGTPPPPADAPAWVLEVLDEEDCVRHRFPLGVGRHRLGSAPDSAVALPAAGVSRRHALLEVYPDGTLELVDLGSKNGTRVAGERIERRVLTRGTELDFGGQGARVRRTGLAALELVARTGAGAARRVADVGSTIGSTLHDRLVRSLRGRTNGGVRAAIEWAALWLEELPMTAVEFRRRGFVVARAERPGASGGAELELIGTADWSLTARAESRRPLDLLAEGFALALEMLAAGGETRSRGETPATPARPPTTVSLRLRQLYHEAARLAQGEIPLLVLGESGSGKEVLAAFIHGCSPRAAGPLVAINCAALPAELLEAELFGIDKGVATGVEARAGLLERARGGTVFLDEIGDMALVLQAKVLRVLEGATYYRVGGHQALTADVRFVAATHMDLAQRAEDGGFRRDLYFRLAAAPLVLPPLRERREDVPLLAAEFFAQETAARGVPSPGLTHAALGALADHAWPGNVRELRNEIARAVLMLDPGEPLDVHHLRLDLREKAGGAPPLSLAAVTAAAEKAAFRTALALSQGDPVRARSLLAVSRTTYYRKLKELGLEGGAPESGTDLDRGGAKNPI